MSESANSFQDVRLDGRIWRFAYCEFDESKRRLQVHGKLVDLESKPLDVLLHLLMHAGEVVTKDELLESIWPGTTVVEGSVATAVSKLRRAIGDESQTIIVTVPRIGYRLGAVVQSSVTSAPRDPLYLGLTAGDSVPGRLQWQLARKLGVSNSSEVWLAQHSKTGEQRVFKFAADGNGLKRLKREVTLSRFLKQSLGDRLDLVPVLEWNFDTAPYYLESEYGGSNLVGWAESEGGLTFVPPATRLRMLINIARTVASAHTLGVLHKDLKPSNVLITPSEEHEWQIRVVDFGSGALLDPQRLDELGITNLGFSLSENAGLHSPTGTLLYIAPEVLRGQSPTASADVYALGVLLYQFVTGDFQKSLSAGWEADIDDPLITEDIADAACGDPKRRLSSVATLVERLETLEQRRAAKTKLEAAQQRADLIERRLTRWRARRPWVAAAVLTLVAGLTATLILYKNALQERNRASRQTAVAQAVNRFLADDLLGRSNPFHSGTSGETLADAIAQSSPDIDRRFPNAPAVAARLHQAIAKALDARSDYSHARPEYEHAATLFITAEGPLSAEAVVTRLQQAAMEARSYSQGSLPYAKEILKEAASKIPKLTNPPADLPVYLASAKGMIALIDNDAKEAAGEFEIAYERSKALPRFDERAQLTFKQRMGFAYIRLGNGPKAEQLFRELISDFTRLDGADNPNALRVQLNLAQAFMIQNKNQEAVAETTNIYPRYVERLGEDHELTMQVLTTRAQCEGALEMWPEAIRDDLKIYDLAVKKQGPYSFFAIATQSDAALAMCRAGHLKDGISNAQQSYDSSFKAFGSRAGLTGGAAHTLASCLIQDAKFSEAERLLDRIDVAAVAQLAGMKDWGANLDLAKAQIAYARGDYSSAQSYVRSAAPVLSHADSEPYQKRELEKLQTELAGHRIGG